MIIKINIEPDELEKIEKLIQERRYSSMHQFSEIAMRNLLKDEDYTGAQLATYENTSLDQLKREQLEDLVTDEDWSKLEEFNDDIGSIEYPIDDRVKKKNDHEKFIYRFYNRFLPIKLSLIAIALRQLKNKEKYISLNNARDEIYHWSSNITYTLREYEDNNNIKRNERISTGLPLTNYSLIGLKGKGLKKKKDKMRSSSNRFLLNMIGSENDTGCALVEMDLIEFSVNNKNEHRLALTKKGMDFLRIANPILKDGLGRNNAISILHSEGGGEWKAFEKDESKFIWKEIIPLFTGEYEIMKKILDIEGEFRADKINEIVKNQIDELIDYEYPNKDTYEKIQKGNKKGEYRTDEEKELIKERLLKNHRVAIMGRLCELGFVKWKLGTSGAAIYQTVKQR